MATTTNAIQDTKDTSVTSLPLLSSHATALELSTIDAGGQDQWCNALDTTVDLPKHNRKGFGEPRYQVMERMRNAGVAMPRWKAAPLDTFLNNPMSFIAPVASHEIHLFIEPSLGAHHPRFRFKNVSESKLDMIIESLEQIENKTEYIATVLESPKLMFHGNILVPESKGGVVDGTSPIRLEFVRGDSLPVSRSGVNPEFSAWQEPFLESLRYNSNSTEIREVLSRALSLIPTVERNPDFDSARKNYRPGYYEIGVAEEPNGLKRFYVYDMKDWRDL